MRKILPDFFDIALYFLLQGPVRKFFCLDEVFFLSARLLSYFQCVQCGLLSFSIHS